MNKQIEALKMAIEALEKSLGIMVNSKGDGTNYDVNVAINNSKQTIQACKEALAEAEKQEWQSLSDDEIELICGISRDGNFWNLCVDIARAIEAKLKEKNHA